MTAGGVTIRGSGVYIRVEDERRGVLTYDLVPTASLMSQRTSHIDNMYNITKPTSSAQGNVNYVHVQFTLLIYIRIVSSRLIFQTLLVSIGHI